MRPISKAMAIVFLSAVVLVALLIVIPARVGGEEQPTPPEATCPMNQGNAAQSAEMMDECSMSDDCPMTDECSMMNEDGCGMMKMGHGAGHGQDDHMHGMASMH